MKPGSRCVSSWLWFAVALLIPAISHAEDKPGRPPERTIPQRLLSRIVVVSKGSSQCTGFIATESTVITAGHCVLSGKEEIEVSVRPNAADETRLSATVDKKVSRDDAAGDIAVLKLERPLPFEPFPIACPPPHGTTASAVGFPLGRDRGNKDHPFATPAFSELTYSGGHYSADDRETVSLLEFLPSRGAAVTHGSSGSPVFVWQHDDWGLLAVHDGSAIEEGTSKVAHYNGTTVSPFLQKKDQCFQSTAAHGATVRVLADACLTPGAEGEAVYSGDCGKVPLLKVEYSNLPPTFSFAVELLDAVTQEVVDDLSYKPNDGGPGMKTTWLTLRTGKTIADNTRLKVRVRVKEVPEVMGKLEPLVIRQAVALESHGLKWSEKGLVAPLNMALVNGQVDLVVVCGDGKEPFWRGTYSAAPGWANYQMDVDRTKVDPAHCRFGIYFKDGKGMIFSRTPIPPPS